MRAMRSLMILFTVAVLVAGAAAGDAPADREATYAYRWMVNEVAGGSVAPPWRLQWARRPIWFERMKPAGQSESPSRRIATGPDGLVTVMRRALYVLDWATGATVWSHELPGEEIDDWNVSGRSFVYSSFAWTKKHVIRGAVDLIARNDRWRLDEPSTQMDTYEMLLTTTRAVIVAPTQDTGATGIVLGIDLERGTSLWRIDRSMQAAAVVSYLALSHDGTAHFFIAPRAGGLYLQSIGVIDGSVAPLAYIYGDKNVRNLPHAITVGSRDVLVMGFNGPAAHLALLAFKLDDKKLAWSTRVNAAAPPGRVAYFKNVVVSPVVGEPAVATVAPNRFIVFDPATGTIARDATLPDGLQWTDPNAVLYSPPYLFTSVIRPKGKGMVYDLVALNTATGKIDWTYNIDEQSELSLTATAEILNFVVRGNTIYVGRADARVMAFENGGKLREESR